MFLLLLPLKKVYIDPYLLNLISLVTNYGYLPHITVIQNSRSRLAIQKWSS